MKESLCSDWFMDEIPLHEQFLQKLLDNISLRAFGDITGGIRGGIRERTSEVTQSISGTIVEGLL